MVDDPLKSKHIVDPEDPVWVGSQLACDTMCLLSLLPNLIQIPEGTNRLAKEVVTVEQWARNNGVKDEVLRRALNVDELSLIDGARRKVLSIALLESSYDSDEIKNLSEKITEIDVRLNPNKYNSRS